MKIFNKIIASGILLGSVFVSSVAQAADYVIDTKGAHAFVRFSIQHLGYSWLHGRFNTFEGQFSYDENAPEASSVSVVINTASVDSNHAERDKHLRSDDFLDVKKFPQAKFESTKVVMNDDGTAKIYGKLTLKDVTKELVIDAYKVGMGKDPWGGFRAGFEGKTRFALKDFNIMKNLGPMSQHVDMTLSVEGIRK